MSLVLGGTEYPIVPTTTLVSCRAKSDFQSGKDCIAPDNVSLCSSSESNCPCIWELFCSESYSCGGYSFACSGDKVGTGKVGQCIVCDLYDALPSMFFTHVLGDKVCRGECVDVKILSHIHQEHLVFSINRLVRVLYDANSSCATSCHVVVYNQKSMMMRSYYQIVWSCIRKVMKVKNQEWVPR